MNILLIGSGGREHALAWKIAQSSLLDKLYIAPGNAGTSQLDQSPFKNQTSTIRNIAISANQSSALIGFAQNNSIDLVVIGPEDPLACGLADEMIATGVKVFGPSKAAVQIEASKAFAKDFMTRHQIPTAAYATFTDFDAALAYLRTSFSLYPSGVVIKASGLAAGKGVLLPENVVEAEFDLQKVMLAREFGVAGEQVVIEERLTGPEISLIAFCDGKLARPMLPAQDHKRAFDGDRGPNTGGMGAYAPAPVCSLEMTVELNRVFLQSAVDGLRSEGCPFVGALYAGLMLTPQGPRVIEYNCRFGDPETQVILPLLTTDILEIFLACAEGRLSDVTLNWKKGTAACVVLASGGYPGKYPVGMEIKGCNAHSQINAFLFHAGTKLKDGKILTSGGRVLCATGWGEDVRAALDAAYSAIRPVTFEGMYYRKDIGWRTL